jgi:hypothetical protein
MTSKCEKFFQKQKNGTKVRETIRRGNNDFISNFVSCLRLFADLMFWGPAGLPHNFLFHKFFNFNDHFLFEFVSSCSNIKLISPVVSD